MVDIQDRFSRQIRSRLKTIGKGLGLIRLLQDAGRIGEARAVLSLLENGVPGGAVQSRKPSKARRSRFSFTAKSA
jgi:hypothetical protein